MRRADRLFQIVQFLRTRRLTTARWLADVLEVSERTIYRDIQDLMSSGVPIEGEAGVGYILRRGYDLPPLMFTRDEIAALSLGVRMVSSWVDPSLAKSAQSVLSKVETALPDSLKKELEQTKLYSPLVRLPSHVALFMGDLRSAIDLSNKVDLTYIRADNTESKRIIWPLGLFFWGKVWTLGSWCELRNSFRNFRLDRIQILKVCNEKYPQEKGKRLEDLISFERCNST